MSKIPVKGMSRHEIWKLAKKVRDLLGVENKLYFDIVAFVEKVIPILCPGFVLEIQSEAEMGNLHGETIPSEQKIRIREDIYIGACKGAGRDRFTLSHEVGHLIMHDESSIVFCKLDRNGKIPQYQDAEWQADVFAGELLAPSYLIDGMSAKDVREKCQVSGACASRQLHAVNCEKEKGYKIVPA